MEIERTAKLEPIKSQSIDMSELDLLEEALVGFGTKRKPGFLHLDEFKVLGDHQAGKEILARLRQILETRASTLRVVFTVSSVDKLNLIFIEDNAHKNYERPFANFASNVHWEPFDIGFLKHLRNVFKNKKKKLHDLEHLVEFFDSVERNPEIMRWLFSSLMLNADQSISEAGNAVINEMGSNHGWDIIWENSSPIRRIVLYMIADGQVNITGVSGKARYKELSGVVPRQNTILNAIASFRKTENLPVECVKKENPKITDHTFRIWLLWRNLNELRIERGKVNG